MKGSKRKFTCTAPLEGMQGLLGPKSSKKYKYDPLRYGEVAKVVGYQKSYSPTNRFQWRTKPVEISAAKWPEVRAHRLKFKTVAISARERMADPNKKQMDEAAFKNQHAYATMFGYLFHLEWESYED